MTHRVATYNYNHIYLSLEIKFYSMNDLILRFCFDFPSLGLPGGVGGGS